MAWPLWMVELWRSSWISAWNIERFLLQVRINRKFDNFWNKVRNLIEFLSELTRSFINKESVHEGIRWQLDTENLCLVVHGFIGAGIVEISHLKTLFLMACYLKLSDHSFVYMVTLVSELERPVFFKRSPKRRGELHNEFAISLVFLDK